MEVHQLTPSQSTTDVLRCTSRNSKYIIHLSWNQQLIGKDALNALQTYYSPSAHRVNTLLMSDRGSRAQARDLAVELIPPGSATPRLDFFVFNLKPETGT